MPSLAQQPNTPNLESMGWVRLTTVFTEPMGLHLESNGGYGSEIGLNGASFMSPHQGVSGTYWRFVPQPNWYYQLVSQFMEPKGLVLDGNGGVNPGSMLGGSAYMSPDRSASGTMWKAIFLGDGIFQLTNQFVESSGLVLEGNGGISPGSTLGGAAFMSSSSNTSGTMWKFVS